MARPREFDEEQVLDAALMTFWRYGFDGTTIRLLTEATGLQRQSLYNAFGDKEGLFQAVLGRYRDHMMVELRRLDDASAGLSELSSYMQSVLSMQRDRDVGACLMVKTAFAPELWDPAIARAVEEGSNMVRRSFARLVRREIDKGRLGACVDPVATAAYLYSVLNGLSALSRTGGSQGQVAEVLKHTFATLR